MTQPATALVATKSSSNHSLLCYAIFPAALGCALGAAILGIQAGYRPDYVVAAVTACAAVLIMFLERVHPYRADWNRSREDVGTDLMHAIVSNLVTPQLLDLALLGALGYAAVWLTGLFGVALWPSHWPLALQLVLALVIGELGQYWVHRLAHEVELLWRVHATHHSASRLYWLNAARFHPLDVALQYSAEMIPLVLLGCSPEALAMFLVFTAVHGMFQHANIDVKLGVLNWVFSMAELHRWHHSKTLVEANSNYGANLIVFDILFKTRFLPSGRLPPDEIGITDLPTFPQRYLNQIASPFRWATLHAQSSSSAPKQSVSQSD